MKQNRTKIRMMTYGALIAALYVALTYVAALLGLSSGVIQLRLSEALTVLPAIVPAVYAPGCVAGLFIGCILANTLTGAVIWDIVFGSIATLLGALGTWLLRRVPRVGTAVSCQHNHCAVCAAICIWRSRCAVVLISDGRHR